MVCLFLSHIRKDNMNYLFDQTWNHLTNSGCCMYEIFSFGKIPYGYYTDDHVAQKQITTGVIPERPDYATSSLYEDVMLKCFRKDPRDRPSFAELKSMLKRFR